MAEWGLRLQTKQRGAAPQSTWSALRLDDDGHLGNEVRGDLHLHFVGAEVLQRLVEQDLVLVHLDAAAVERLRSAGVSIPDPEQGEAAGSAATKGATPTTGGAAAGQPA